MTTATKTTYQELFEAINSSGGAIVPKAPNQPRDEYLKLLLVQVDKLPDATWDALSTNTQNWYNAALGRINSTEPLQFLDGFDNETEKAALEAQPTARMDSKKPNQANKPKSVAAAASPKGAVVKGVSETVREIVILNPAFSNDQIKAAMLKEGWEEKQIKMSSLTTLRADTLKIMEIAQRNGWRKEEAAKAS